MGPAPTPPEPPAPLRILVADDVRMNRHLARRLLERQGHTVQEAVDGKEAVQLAFGNTFDLILMDVQMPEMDGYTATRKIRVTDPTTPIVAVTASSSQPDRRRCLEAGMNAVIVKPVKTDALLQLLSELKDLLPGGSGTLPGIVDADRHQGVQPHQEPDLDLEQARESAMDDHGYLIEMWDRFMRTTADILAVMLAELDRLPSERLTRKAHGLKGTARAVGAVRVAQLAEKLEECGPTVDREPARRLIRSLDSAVSDFKRTIANNTDSDVH